MSARESWRGPAIAAAACAAVALVVILVSGWSVVAALAAPSPESGAFDLASLDERSEAHDEGYEERLLAQLDGRSMFFIPPEPPPPPPPPRDDEPREERPPPPPSRYGGPELMAIFDGKAWFGDGRRVAVGEEVDGVEVLELAPPWSATVRWRGVEFTIELFQRDKVVLPK